jgi:DNA-binding NarL/FixJ family response regulator
LLCYDKSNPRFRKKLLDTYHTLLYTVQARPDMFAPRFFEEPRRLKSRGLSNTKVAEKLGVSSKTVVKRLKELWR